MQDNLWFDHYHYCRGQTLQLFSFITGRQADLIPDGFNNSLRWNLGHILVTQELIMFQFGINQPGAFDTTTINQFIIGSSPKEWTEPPPALDEIKQHLQQQEGRIKAAFTGLWTEEITKPFDLGKQGKETIGDLFLFTLWHEAWHQGVINSYRQII